MNHRPATSIRHLGFIAFAIWIFPVLARVLSLPESAVHVVCRHVPSHLSCAKSQRDRSRNCGRSIC